jgi:glycosyltransferase involved in cell wall biosynthesis
MIDVIIPAYNAFDTIKDTLESLVIQKNRDNLKVYIINDGSTSSYDYIIEPFRDRLDVTEIITENHGPGQARQTGIEQSHNEYIFFIDADDVLVDEDSLSDLYDTIQGKDFAQSYFIKDSQNKEEILPPQHCYLHGKLFRRDIIEKNSIHFDIKKRLNGDIYEDSTFNQLYSLYCNKKATTKKVVYHYRFNQNSITNKDYNNAIHLQNFIDAMTWFFNEVDKRNIHNDYEISWDTYAICFHAYFLYFINQSANDFVFEDMSVIKKFYDKYKDCLSYKEQCNLYSRFSLDYVIPNITFYDFMKKIK